MKGVIYVTTRSAVPGNIAREQSNGTAHEGKPEVLQNIEKWTQNATKPHEQSAVEVHGVGGNFHEHECYGFDFAGDCGGGSKRHLKD